MSAAHTFAIVRAASVLVSSPRSARRCSAPRRLRSNAGSRTREMASASALEVDSHGDLGGETSVEAAIGIVMGRDTAPAVGMPGVSGTSDWNKHNRLK